MQFIVFRPLIRVNMLDEALLYVDLKMQILDKGEWGNALDIQISNMILHNGR